LGAVPLVPNRWSIAAWVERRRLSIVSPLVATALWREQYPAVSESPWVLCWSSGDFLSGVLWGSVHVATPVVETGVIGLLLENLGETNDSTPFGTVLMSIAHFPSVSLMSLV